MLVTGVTGHLGRIVLEARHRGLPAGRITALAAGRGPGAAAAATGVDVRHGDYADSASPVRAFAGIEQLLFVSSSALEGVAKQHDNVIRACAGRAVHPLGGTPGPPLVLEEAPERAEERSPGVGAAAYRRGARRLVAPHTLPPHARQSPTRRALWENASATRRAHPGGRPGSAVRSDAAVPRGHGDDAGLG